MTESPRLNCGLIDILLMGTARVWLDAGPSRYALVPGSLWEH